MLRCHCWQKINLCDRDKTGKTGQRWEREREREQEREGKGHLSTCWLSWKSAGSVMENEIPINNSRPWLGIFKFSQLTFITVLKITCYAIWEVIVAIWELYLNFKKKKYSPWEHKCSKSVLVLQLCKAFFKVLVLHKWMASVALVSQEFSAYIILLWYIVTRASINLFKTYSESHWFSKVGKICWNVLQICKNFKN